MEENLIHGSVQHPITRDDLKHAAKMLGKLGGLKGGRSKSLKKQMSSRENGRKHKARKKNLHLNSPDSEHVATDEKDLS